MNKAKQLRFSLMGQAKRLYKHGFYEEVWEHINICKIRLNGAFLTYTILHLIYDLQCKDDKV
jgi:hypothetical protein